MKNILAILLCVLAGYNSNSQTSKDHYAKLEAAKKTVGKASAEFQTCVVRNDCDSCINDLLKQANNPYEKSLAAAILYDIDPEKSFQLHKEAYLSDKTNSGFTLEYAMELHRQSNYAEAIALYEQYTAAKPADFRVQAWLADCYINAGNIDKAVQNWNALQFPSRHTDIDFALHTIYGDTSQLKKRSELKKRIGNGETALFYDLVFLDNNWKIDWWNSIVQENLLKEDMILAKKVLGEANSQFRVLTAYNKIRELSKSGSGDEIKALLEQNNIIVNNGALLQCGNIMSDLLRMCFINSVLDEAEFYKSRGNELLDLAKATGDKELLNIYAYLQATVEGKVAPEIDKLGWTDFKDERFAISYFIGLAHKNTYDNPELAQAIADFPNSAKLQWVKLNCAYIEGKDLRPEMITIIKKEFKSLGSDPNHYSYNLNSYFVSLQPEE